MLNKRQEIRQNRRALDRRAFLVLYLAGNDLRLRYAGSVLGILWSFVLPVLVLGVFALVFGQGFRNPPVEGVPYMLWFSAAYIPWQFMSDTLSQGTGCLLGYRHVIRSQPWQVRLLPLVRVTAGALVHLPFAAAFLIAAVMRGQRLFLCLCQMLWCFGMAIILLLCLCMLFGTLVVFFRDMTSLVQLLIQVLFFLTPIIWSEEQIADENIRELLMLNPFSYVTRGYRALVLGRGWFWEDPPGAFLFLGGLCLALFLCRKFFHRLIPYLADEG